MKISMLSLRSGTAFNLRVLVTALAVSIGHGLPGEWTISDVGQAYAEGKGGGRGYHGGRGGHGATTRGGHESTDHEHDNSSHVSGKKGQRKQPGRGLDKGSGHDHEESEGHTDTKGETGHPRYKDGSTGAGSGVRRDRPVWAKEGISEVELGRLNVIRSPSRVIDRAFSEAVSTFDAIALGPIYSMSAEAFSNYVATHWDTATIIDSPLQNLGLLRDLLTTGNTQLGGVTPASRNDLAGIFLGTASDKALPISQGTVAAVVKMMGVAMADADVASIAVKAEDVRRGILTGHGE